MSEAEESAIEEETEAEENMNLYGVRAGCPFNELFRALREVLLLFF